MDATTTIPVVVCLTPPAERIPAAGYGLLFFYHVAETATVSLVAIPVVITVAITTIAVTLSSGYYSFRASAEMETMAVSSANSNVEIQC